jgi:integrase
MVRIRVLSALKIKQDLKPGMYSDGLGLYLQVRPGNAKSWIFRYRTHGKLRDMGLGPLHSVSLAEAREKAALCRTARLNGLDPLEERRKDETANIIEASRAITFEQCAESYITTHKDGWKNGKHASQWTATLRTYVYPVFQGKAVAEINDELVLQVLRPIWKGKTETASRVRGRIERILDWARVMKYRTGDNPARWRGHLDHLLPKRSKVAAIIHHAALPIDETPAFIQILRREATVTARALEYCILTATRTNETLGMRWDEVDESAQLWTVPSVRMKASRDHRVPLAPEALLILAEMREIRTSEYVFPGGRAQRPLSSMAFLMMLRRLKRTDITAHGFRSTFRDWAAERTAFPNEVVEMALAHTIGNKVEAAYRRGDLFNKRRQLAEAWASFCSGTTDIASDL